VIDVVLDLAGMDESDLMESIIQLLREEFALQVYGNVSEVESCRFLGASTPTQRRRLVEGEQTSANTTEAEDGLELNFEITVPNVVRGEEASSQLEDSFTSGAFLEDLQQRASEPEAVKTVSKTRIKAYVIYSDVDARVGGSSSDDVPVGAALSGTPDLLLGDINVLGMSIPWYVFWLAALATIAFVVGTGYTIYRERRRKLAAQKPSMRVHSNKPDAPHPESRSFLGAVKDTFSAAGAAIGGLLAPKPESAWKYAASPAYDDQTRPARHPFQSSTASTRSLSNAPVSPAAAPKDDVIDGTNIEFVEDDSYGAGLGTSPPASGGAGFVLSNLRRLSGSGSFGRHHQVSTSEEEADAAAAGRRDEEAGETPGVWQSFRSLCSNMSGGSSRKLLNPEVDEPAGQPLTESLTEEEEEGNVSPVRPDRARAALRASSGRRRARRSQLGDLAE